MVVTVHVCDALGQTVYEKTETMCIPAPHIPPVVMHVEVTRERYRQTRSFIYLGRVIPECPDVSNGNSQADKRVLDAYQTLNSGTL